MSRSPAERAIPLIELIHLAAVRPEMWNSWLGRLAPELGDPAIMLTLQLPRSPATQVSYRIHSQPDYGQIFADFAARGELPWSLATLYEYERFVSGSEFISDEDLAETEFYRRYMAPQGLVAEGQIGHVFGCDEGRPLAALGIYRRIGGRKIAADDIEMLDLLVPHLRVAYQTYCDLREAHFRREAIAEVLDRFPMGVLLLDCDLTVVYSNRAARRIVRQVDGLVLRDGVLRATERETAEEFGAVVRRAVRRQPGAPVEQRICPIARPSGRRPYESLVTSLVTPPAFERAGQAAAVVFIADPDEQQLRMPDLLIRLHELTHAETELAALLCAGESMESAAAARDISAHTARSQLKRIFAKTGVNRQADLVRLLLSSVSTLDEMAGEDEDEPRARSGPRSA